MGFNNRYVPSRGHYSGTISASAFVGDGSGLTGISGSGVPGGAGGPGGGSGWPRLTGPRPAVPSLT